MEEQEKQVPSPVQPQEEKKHLLKKFPKGVDRRTSLLIVSSVLVVLLGVGTGWLLSGRSLGRGTSTTSSEAMTEVKVGATEAGVTDESSFTETAEGTLEKGGIEGEGTHHLVREGGESKYVYLTSGIIDLELFVGKKVKVWGETIAGRYAPWLMDVGGIKVTE